MEAISYKTVSASKETVTKGWVLVDAENETLGRLASKVAYILRGKDKTNFTPHVDTGDNVIIINAEKVKFSGNKLDDKVYQNFSGYPGGLKEETAKDLQKRRPEVILERAIKGMLPKNRLGRKMYKKLFVYAGTAHQHTAQQPKELKF